MKNTQNWTRCGTSDTWVWWHPLFTSLLLLFWLFWLGIFPLRVTKIPIKLQCFFCIEFLIFSQFSFKYLQKCKGLNELLLSEQLSFWQTKMTALNTTKDHSLLSIVRSWRPAVYCCLKSSFSLSQFSDQMNFKYSNKIKSYLICKSLIQKNSTQSAWQKIKTQNFKGRCCKSVCKS